MTRLLPLLSRHRVVAVYLLSLLWLAMAMLAFSLAADRGLENAALVLGVAGGVGLVYAASWALVRWVRPRWAMPLRAVAQPRLGYRGRVLLLVLTGLYAMVAVTHIAMLGYIPIVEALRTDSDLGVSLVRQGGYFDLPLYMRYASDYSVKALGPALLLVSYFYRSRLFWVALMIGSLYSMGLFARILPIILFLPLIVHMLLAGRWLHLGAVVLLLTLMLATVTAISSISIRDSLALPTPTEPVDAGDPAAGGALSLPVPPPLPRLQDSDWRRTSIAYALYDRVLMVPGQVMDQWFYYYADPVRREHGCGYRIFSRLFGCAYVPVPSKLYAFYYRENVQQGMRGSLNAASFMTEFANFGPLGLILSALAGGVLFAAIMVIYRDHPLALPMNLPLIMVAMESSLVTAINSGAGWLAMTLIFILFFRVRDA